MAEDDNLVGGDVASGLEHLEGLSVAVELGIKIDVACRAALTVATPRFIDPQCHVSASREVVDDGLVRAQDTPGRVIDGEQTDPLNQEQRRVLPLPFGKRDDRSQLAGAAGHRAINDFVLVALFERAPLERHVLGSTFLTPSKCNRNRGTRFLARDCLDQIIWSRDLGPVQREQKVAGLKAGRLGRRAGDDLFNRGSGASVELQTLSQLVRNRTNRGPEKSPTLQICPRYD